MAGYEDITYEIDEAAAVITINRPERYNAFRGKTVEELIKAFRAAWADIILTGAGDKAFCTGGDVKQRAETGDYGPTESGMFEIGYLHKLIRDVPKLVIAAVNGVAVGGGHAACPVRFVDRRGERDVRSGRAASWIIRCRIRIRLFGAGCRGEASAGNVVIVPSVRRGHGRAVGLGEVRCASGSLDAEAKALAAEIAAKSPTALRFLKQSFNADTDHQAGLSNMAMSALEIFVPTRAWRARGRSTRSVQPTSPGM